ncbi:MAG: hypothetical protein M1817_004177 [Caeruleum heppii]|nr:MAG: hypothetical protein M1817_004177 [Caeruleum heppii]
MITPLPDEAPEHHSRAITPVSPRPVYLPEPSNIPVLEKQMDPVFNDTSTHIDPVQPTQPYAPDPEHDTSRQDQTASVLNGAIGSTAGKGGPAETPTQLMQDVNDDYAMSLDFDDDEGMEDGQDSVIATNELIANDIASLASAADHDPHPSLPPVSTETAVDPSLPAISDPIVDASNSFLASLDAGAPLPSVAEAPTTSVPSVDDANAPADHDLPLQGSEDAADVGSGGVDIQVLLDNLSTPAATAPTVDGITSPTTTLSAVDAGAASKAERLTSPPGLPNPASLPPRPPPQQNAVSHPAYSPQDDIRSYHPHTQKPSAAPSFAPQQPNALRLSQSAVPTVIAAGAPGTASQPGTGLPPPPLATFQQPALSASKPHPSPTSDANSKGAKFDQNGANQAASVADEDDIHWSPEMQKMYDDFLQKERVYVSEGQWDRFPPNSRLFIGNLPTEKVTKRDLFHSFHKHGRLAQISIKQAYGFIQFFEANACHRALQAEQGQAIRGRKMHLEISKPQKNTRNAGADGVGARGGPNRRSRSPDYYRGASSPRGGGPPGSRGRPSMDRGDRLLDSWSGPAGRDREFAERGRMRDDYRPPRSPSPRGYHGRDEYRGPRDRDMRDRYDRRSRSRSRSPYGRSRRYRSRTPPSRKVDDRDELPFPPRAPQDVPDLQIIIMDDVDSNFITFVEKAIRARGLRTEKLFFDSRLSMSLIIRRQIVEGVQAVCKLARQSQSSVKIPLQVFDRRGGANNVRFDEYENLDPSIAAELVVRAKQTHGAPSTSQYNAPPQGHQSNPPLQNYAQPPPQQAGPNTNGQAPNIANLITSLDGPTLQKLLGALQQPGQAPTGQLHPQSAAAALPPDLAALLGAGAGQQGPPPSRQQQQQQSYRPPPPRQQQSDPYAALAANPALAGNPALAAMLAGVGNRAPQQGPPPQQQQQGGQPTQQVQDIMQQLARWKQ